MSQMENYLFPSGYSDLQPLGRKPEPYFRILEVTVISPMSLSGRVSFTLFPSGYSDLQPLYRYPEPYFRTLEVAVISPMSLSGKVSFTLFPSGYSDLQPLSRKPEPSPPESHPRGGRYKIHVTVWKGTLLRSRGPLFLLRSPDFLQDLNQKSG